MITNQSEPNAVDGLKLIPHESTIFSVPCARAGPSNGSSPADATPAIPRRAPISKAAPPSGRLNGTAAASILLSGLAVTMARCRVGRQVKGRRQRRNQVAPCSHPSPLLLLRGGQDGSDSPLHTGHLVRGNEGCCPSADHLVMVRFDLTYPAAATTYVLPAGIE